LKDGKIPDTQPSESPDNHARRPVDLLFGSGVRVDVLWCLMNFDLGLDQNEIVHTTGRSIKDVQRALKILSGLGLITKSLTPQNRTRYYLAVDNPWLIPLRTLLECAIGGLDILKDNLREIPGISVAFVFGSFATSDQTPTSDIDLMVIGEFDEDGLLKIISGLEKKIGREIQLINNTPSEWYNAVQERKHFITSLMESPKIFLKGSKDDLDRIALGLDA